MYRSRWYMNLAWSPEVSVDAPQGSATKWNRCIPAARASRYRGFGPSMCSTREASSLSDRRSSHCASIPASDGVETAGPFATRRGRARRPGLVRVVRRRRLHRDRARDLLGVAELAQRLALDQPHTFPGKSEDLPGLAQAERTTGV